MTSFRKYDVAVINTVALNGGDAAILDAVIESVCHSLKKTKDDIVILDRNHSVVEKYMPAYHFSSPGFEICRSKRRGAAGKVRTLLSVAYLLLLAGYFRLFGMPSSSRPSSAKTYLRILSNCQAVVSTGGTMFVDRYSIFPKFLEVLISFILGKPIYLYTQSFEPFEKVHNRLMMAFIFKVSKLIMVRGEKSFDVVSNALGKTDKAYQLADVVFRFRRNNRPAFTKRLVYISVRPWTYADPTQIHRYRLAMSALARHLVIKMDRDVVFVSTCQGIPEYHINDSEEASAILKMVGNEAAARVSVNSDYHSPSELMDLFASSELVIGTRLHACILAMCARTAVLPIAYEDKTYEVFGRIIPGSRILGYATLDADQLIAEVDSILADRINYIKRLDYGVQAEQEDSLRSDGLLAMYHQGNVVCAA